MEDSSDPIRFDCTVVYALAGLVRYDEARQELARLGSHWVFPCAETRAIAEAIMTNSWEYILEAGRKSRRLCSMGHIVALTADAGVPAEPGHAAHYVRLMCHAGADAHVAETLRWAADRIEAKDVPVEWINRRIEKSMKLARTGIMPEQP